MIIFARKRILHLYLCNNKCKFISTYNSLIIHEIEKKLIILTANKVFYKNGLRKEYFYVHFIQNIIYVIKFFLILIFKNQVALKTGMHRIRVYTVISCETHNRQQDVMSVPKKFFNQLYTFLIQHISLFTQPFKVSILISKQWWTKKQQQADRQMQKLSTSN